MLMLSCSANDMLIALELISKLKSSTKIVDI